MNKRNVAIIQARMGSTRFPGKMLARLGGIPIIEWVIRRVARANTLAHVVLATSSSRNDDSLANFVASLGTQVFRGSEADVLGRFIGAARMTNSDNVIRICADNPFIDPKEVDRLVIYFSENECDYACNHQDRLRNCYADGFGAEILAASLLEQIAVRAIEPSHREHATRYLWDNPNDFELRAVPAPIELAFPELRFDVDTPDDLAKLEVLTSCGIGLETSAREIIQIAQAYCSRVGIKSLNIA